LLLQRIDLTLQPFCLRILGNRGVSGQQRGTSRAGADRLGTRIRGFKMSIILIPRVARAASTLVQTEFPMVTRAQISGRAKIELAGPLPVQIGDGLSRLAAIHDKFCARFEMGEPMIGPSKRIWLLLSSVSVILVFGFADAQQSSQTGAQNQAGAPLTQPAAQNPYLMGSEGYGKGPRGLTSFQPIAIDQPFAARMAQDVAAKPGIESEHQTLLERRYDLSDRPAQGLTMDRGKSLQEGVRVKLPAGTTWEQLAAMTPDEIRERGLWPKGFLPLPHPIHSTGGFVFPRNAIDVTKRQDGRDLTRFDIDFDLPERFLAEFPPAMFLVQRPDLGDVSQGQLISIANYFEMFNGILTPRQLEGLRLC
jgi:hypothetical protein